MSYIFYKIAEFIGALVCGTLFIMLILVILMAITSMITELFKLIIEFLKKLK